MILKLPSRPFNRSGVRPVVAVAVPALLAVTGLLAVGCSEEPPTDFTADTRSGFMAACSQPVDDTRLVSGICQCVFDNTQIEIPFTEFAAADDRMIEQPELPLSDEITGIIADCVIEEGNL